MNMLQENNDILILFQEYTQHIHKIVVSDMIGNKSTYSMDRSKFSLVITSLYRMALPLGVS